MKLLITCEHAGNRIPPAWQDRVSIPKHVLESHRGIDIGAKRLAQDLAKALKTPLFLFETSRLFVEGNRSLHHQRLFSEFSQHLTRDEKQEVIESIYQPYRDEVQAYIGKSLPVFHVSVHSFTPVLNGVARNADIGLLYDPSRAREKKLAASWKSHLHGQWRVRMNYPYLGTSDGFITYLRRQYSATRYAGMELEVMNSVLTDQRRAVTESLVRSLQSIVGGC